MPNQTPIVMISSTARDLPDYRDQARSACLRLDAFPKMMEDLPASPKDAIAESLAMVDEADVYVGIFAYRYGYVPDGHEISITQMEYEHAVKRGIPVLIYVIDEDVPWLFKNMDKGQNAEKLETLKEDMKKACVVNFFKSPEDLRALVLHGLLPYMGDSDSEGVASYVSSALDTYLQKLSEQCMVLPLAKIGGHAGLEQSLSLNDVYIGLNTKTREEEDWRGKTKLVSSNREEEDRGGKIAIDPSTPDEEVRYLSAQEATVRSHRMVLLGDPGAGKSTFVKRLMAEMAEDLKTTREGLVPVFIILRDLAPRLGEAQADLKKLNADQRRGRLAEIVVEQVIADLVNLHAQSAEQALREAFKNSQVHLVFDGLDEVPFGLRSLVHAAVDAAALFFKLERVIVTCRIRSYTEGEQLDGYDAHILAPFDSDQVQQFIEGWYNAQVELKAMEAAAARMHIENLQTAVQQDHLKTLAQNPMLLTTMIGVHQQETELPRERVILYQKAVDILLRKWQLIKGAIPEDLDALLGSPERIRPVIERLAYEAHKKGVADTASDLPRREALEILEAPEYLGSLEFANRFLNWVDVRSGLLIGRGGAVGRPSTFSFPHRTFQEYLAGCYLVRGRSVREIRDRAREGNAWTVAVEMGAEELFINRRNPDQLLDNAASLLPDLETIIDEVSARRALWAANMVQVAGDETVERDEHTGVRYLEKLRTALVQALSTELPLIERAEAGRILCELGDPRKELRTLEDMAFCHIPAGPFLMGSSDEDKKAYRFEKPQELIDVPYDYWISMYSVTQAQFSVFVNEGGYEEEKWWTEKGWAFAKELDPKGPAKYRDPFGFANHPVVGVSWYEAKAFVTWLTNYARQQGWISKKEEYKLPNEPEWEKAARGTEGLIYPWGDEVSTEYCNYSETGIGATTTPGCFPGGVSTFGVHDTSGNVDEWTRSIWDKIPYTRGGVNWAEREDLESGSARVIRGGSWSISARSVRSADRGSIHPESRDINVGFRVVRTVL